MKALRNIALIATASVALCVSTATGFAQTVLNLNSQLLETAPSSAVDQWFADEVARRTNDEVKIRIFFGETLGRASESLSLLREGAIDMAMVSPGFFTSDLPFTALPNSMPMALNSVNQAKVLMKRLVEEVPEFAAEHQRNGIRSLFFHNLNPYYLLSKQPVTSVEGMSGKKMRTWGTDMPRLVSAVNGVPVTVGLSELYESLSSGAIDAAPFSYDYIQTYRLYEVARNISTVPLFVGPTGGVWISNGAWDRLTPEQQKIMLEVADEALERDYEVVTQAADGARDYLVQAGVQIHEFPADEERKWRDALPDFFGDWIARMEADGKGDDARKTVEIWREVVETVE